MADKILKKTHEKRMAQAKRELCESQDEVYRLNRKLQNIDELLAEEKAQTLKSEKLERTTAMTLEIVIKDLEVAHSTLHTVNADENNTATIVRVLGNVQGLVFAGLNRAKSNIANASGMTMFSTDIMVKPMRVYQDDEVFYNGNAERDSRKQF